MRVDLKEHFEMIIYFSGTGNSKFAAEFLAEKLSDECVSLNDILKHGGSLKLNSEKPYVIVAPIYAARYPKFVSEKILKAELSGNKKIYFVATMGAPSRIGGQFYKKLATEKGMDFCGYFKIVMQNNFLPGDVMPSKEAADEQLTEVIPQLKEAAECIKEERTKETDKGTAADTFLSGLASGLFGRFGAKMFKMKVGDKCNGCTVCAEHCPVNNIEMVDGRAVMKNRCVLCFSCINRCPVEAINIEGKTEKCGRYVCPEYKDWKERHPQSI